MIEISQYDLMQILTDESKVVLITEDFSGHRLDWLSQLSSYLGKWELTILTIDASRLFPINSDLELKICSEFVDKRDLMNQIGKSYVKASLIFWDGDNWLFWMSRVSAPMRVLIMRPYLLSKSLRNILVYAVKQAVIFLLEKVKKVDFAFLSIPFSIPATRQRYWVDDELIIESEFLMDLRFRRNSRLEKEKFSILVPGYITERKNPDLVIEACKLLSINLKNPFELIFQGRIDEALANKLASFDFSWLVLKDVYFQRREYLALLSEADVVVIPYSNTYSSGVAVECIALGIPIIMLQNELWQGAAAQEGINLTMVKFDAKELGSALQMVLTKPAKAGGTFDFKYVHKQTALGFLARGKQSEIS